MNWRKHMPGSLSRIADGARLVAEQSVLLPAAAHLPRPAAHMIAGSLGRMDAAFARRRERAQLARLFGVSGPRAASLSRLRARAMYADLVAIRHVARGIERRLDTDEATSALPADVREHLAQGGALVATSAHLGFGPQLRLVEALLGMASMGARADGPISVVTGTAPRASAHDFFRRRLNLRDSERRLAIERIARGGDNVRLSQINSGRWSAGARQLLDTLSRRGGTVMMNVDVDWPGGMTHAFAGRLDRTFSLGAAKLARRSRCPLVFLQAVGGPRRWTLQCSELLHMSDMTDAQAMARVLDEAERAIGLHPTEAYLLDLSGQRSWDAEAGQWTRPDEGAAPTRCAQLSLSGLS